ncbi:MAG: hypothetical protein N2112_03760 [Gemmataceae bacterium]|nr:hypothetical protein [Gemmataceae bacterium]
MLCAYSYFWGKLQLNVAIPIVADTMSRRRYGTQVAKPISESHSVKAAFPDEQQPRIGYSDAHLGNALSESRS